MTADADEQVTVAVIDDDTIVREGLRALLPVHHVACTFEHHSGFLDRRPAVDLVVLDLNLDGVGQATTRHGAAAIADIHDAGYPVLIYTNEHRRLVLAGCLGAGADGVIHKTQPLQDLADAITAVHNGQTVITPALTGLA
jgi:DNA-binding NarL/FixJ family response regulator